MSTQSFENISIERIVKQVLEQLGQDGLAVQNQCTPVVQKSIPSSGRNGICDTVDEAVIAAQKAQSRLMELTLDARKKIIEAMRQAAIANAQELGKMAVEETKLGRVPHKIAKIIIAAEKTPGVEDIEPRAFSGDKGLTIVEKAPYGVVGSITPSTNPASTIVNNSISFIAAGNSVVFNPHPSAKRVSHRTVEILNEAIVKAGGPADLINAIASPTLDTSDELMKHPGNA